MERVSIQTIYIRMMNIIYNRYFSRIDEKAKNAYLLCIFVWFAFYFILFFNRSFHQDFLNTHTQRQALSGTLLIMVSFLSMNGPLEQVKWRKRITVPYYLCAIGLITTGLIHPIGNGYLNFGIMLIFVYPCLYLSWNNRGDYELLFDSIAKSFEIVGSAFFIYCLLFLYSELGEALKSGERFCGPAENSNLLSMIGMATFCTALYMAFRKRNNHIQRPVHVAVMLSGLFMTLIGQSRASILVAIISLLCAICYGYKQKRTRRNNNRNKIILILIMIVLIALLMPVVFKVEKTNDQEGFGNSVVDRFTMEGKDLNSYSSGRIFLWKNYAKHLNMIGNDFNEVDWEELTGNTVTHAHNNFLEYGYRCGIPVASLFTLLELLAGLLALGYLFSKTKRRDCYLFVIIMMVMYAIESVVDIATIPMERHAPFFFYMILTVMIDPCVQNNEHNRSKI